MSVEIRKGELLKFLRRCRECDDRVTLANLRCALRDNLKHRAWPMLAHFGGIGDHTKEYDHYAKVVQTIAGLFATHPQEIFSSDFGAACNRLVDSEERRELFDSKKVGSVGKRFQYLLSSEPEEICDRAIRFVFRMKSQGITVNYDELFDGLFYWGDKIKTRWAGSFWSVPHLEEEVE